MQTVNAVFTAEERDYVRRIAHNLGVSWKKETNLGNRTFTIGVSTIGGSDVIGLNPGALGGAGIYRYFDESDYVLALAWERELNMPYGGLTKAMAEAELDNTSGRFTPRHMGGNSELYTAILPRRPFRVNAGFDVGGIDVTLPQFSGVTTKPPLVDVRNRRVRIQGSDYIDFFQNRKLDKTVMFTGQRTDEVIEGLFSQLGMSTAQYSLDVGINIIPFGVFESGSQFSDIINALVQAENGHFYQDEEGRFRFENRQHWDSSPYNQVQRIITTAQVITQTNPEYDHIINVVEINAKIRNKQPEQIIFRLNPFDSIRLEPNTVTEVFVDYEDPILQVTAPSATGEKSFFVGNQSEDNTGTDLTTSVNVSKITNFAQASKIEFTNSSAQAVYLTSLVISGRPAKVERQLYLRDQDDSSITAYEERPLRIDNPYIQNESWAGSLARMILNDYSDPENLQKITIRAIPELQMGDLISWQGRYWRVFGIRAGLDASSGFIQHLTLLQREITTYFRIGISTIGGTDKIAP